MIRSPSAWLLVVTLTGCAPGGTLDEVRISDQMAKEEIATVKRAVAEWCKASEDTCLPVSVVSQDPNVVILDHVPNDWEAERACASYAPANRRVEFLRGCRISINTMLHELGHAMGPTEHLPGRGSIMTRRSISGMSCLSHSDVEFVCSYVGCRSWSGTCGD